MATSVPQTRPSVALSAFAHLARSKSEDDKCEDKEKDGKKAEDEGDDEEEAKSKKAKDGDDEEKSESEDDEEASKSKKSKSKSKAKSKKSKSEKDEDDDEDDDDDDQDDDEDGDDDSDREDDDDPDARHARARERGRIKAIMLSDVGKRNPAAAAHLATGTSMSRKQVIQTLAAMEAAMPQGSSGGGRESLRNRMTGVKDPALGAGGESAAPNLAQQIVQAGKKARGEA